jgi:F-type H+-transporting ATPase subunit gamma
MPGAKEIRTKIASIKSTQKITKAMQMVAASKMRKAQERMRAARPYAEKIRNVIGHIRHTHPDTVHPYLVDRPTVKSVGLIVVSTDRGLCGGLNVNVFKQALNVIKEHEAQGRTVQLCLFGSKAAQFFKRLKMPILATVTGLGDRPHVESYIGAVRVMLNAFVDGSIDELHIVHAEFINTMSQKPRVLQLVPAQRVDSDELQSMFEYIYEPSAADILDSLLFRYVESQVYSGAVENVACEMAARMVAMKSATDNAGKLIDELQLVYNKARQASITKEISEIVGGAAAV